METEARVAPLQFRAEMLANVRKLRRDVNTRQTRLNKARTERPGAGAGAGAGAGHGAGAGAGADYGTSGGLTDQYRQQVVAGTQILARTGDSINRAHQVAIETDQVGM